MLKTTLGKKNLQKERQKLKLYQKLLPSIDLKRTQLRAEYARVKNEMIVLTQETEKIINDTAKHLPMLANKDVQLGGLITISSIDIGEQSIMGVKVPYVKEILFKERDYAMLATPFWLEAYIAKLKQAIEMKLKAQVMTLRIEKLGYAVRRITQHVNLFEKILIPNAQKTIQRIQILVGEDERNAVVRSKLAKSLHKQDQPDSFEGIL